MSRLKLQSLITAILVYIFILTAIFFALFFQPSLPKAKTFTDKKSNIIEVSLASPAQVAKAANIHKKAKSAKKSVKKRKKPVKKREKKKIVKKVRNVKKSVKKSIKKAKPVKKVVKKQIKKPTKKHVVKKAQKVAKSSSSAAKSVKKASKPNTGKLFGSIDKDILKSSPKKGTSTKAESKKDRNNGVVNKYMANIQRTLQGWPAQSNFAGEKIRVELTVYSTGLFDYKILYRSLNPEFNEALKSYLEQLKRFGFGPHSNPKPYKIVVEFIAK